MQVSVQVLASCILQSATLDFGEYIGQERTASTQIQFRCQPNVPYVVALDSGQYYDGVYRTIANGPHRIRYVLRQSNGHEWGDSDFANSYHWAAGAPGIANGAWQNLIVNGTLFGGVIVAAGVYTDTVLITINF
jgi:spore coat protein U-like protein